MLKRLSPFVYLILFALQAAFSHRQSDSPSISTQAYENQSVSAAYASDHNSRSFTCQTSKTLLINFELEVEDLNEDYSSKSKSGKSSYWSSVWSRTNPNPYKVILFPSCIVSLGIKKLYIVLHCLRT